MSNQSIEIQNSKAFLIFMLGIILLCSASIVPISIRIFDFYAYVLPFVAFPVVIGVIVYLRPGYFSIIAGKGRVMIKNRPGNEIFLEFPMADFAGFKIYETEYGINTWLILIKKSPVGMQQCNPIKISFLDKKQKEQLNMLLNELRGIYSN